MLRELRTRRLCRSSNIWRISTPDRSGTSGGRRAYLGDVKEAEPIPIRVSKGTASFLSTLGRQGLREYHKQQRNDYALPRCSTATDPAHHLYQAGEKVQGGQGPSKLGKQSSPFKSKTHETELMISPFTALWRAYGGHAAGLVHVQYSRHPFLRLDGKLTDNRALSEPCRETVSTHSKFKVPDVAPRLTSTSVHERA
eukprot:scaffold1167_cov418-Prasinococcus_capsulatus_cf.AAC.7